MLQIAFAISVTSLLAVPAPAFALTGEELLKMCLASDASAKAACDHYIQGFTEGMLLGTATIVGGEEHYCPPKDGVDWLTAKRIILGNLAANPQHLKAFAASYAASALRQAYPCR